ncbi:MAG: diaminopropionate ammonia-lyase [Hyphomicrobiales bacterium]
MIRQSGVRHVHNRQSGFGGPYGDEQRAVLNQEAYRAMRREISSWPGYAPTPLVPLPGLAKALSVGEILYKDEAMRFSLKSFKALGGAYAVLRVLQQRLAERGFAHVTAADLIAGRHRDIVGDLTVAAATDGNHGRSVAWGAKMFGARCTIYLHGHVSQSREDEIANFGATIARVPGSYDDSVRQCAEDSARNGWNLVADTNSGGGDASVPSMVMQGYTLMVAEFMEQLQGRVPSHVFVQGGVGGIAAAVAGHLWETLGAKRPRIVVVEPQRADCIFRSIAAGTPTPVDGDVNTFMACLAAGEISPLAWPILKHAADDVLTLPEEAAPEAMRLLAAGVSGDPPIVSGESGCAAIAGLIEAALDPTLRQTLGLTPGALIVAIGSEGATDAATYEAVVGRSAEDVQRRTG